MTPDSKISEEAVKAAFALVDAQGISNVANAAGDMRPYMECAESANGAALRILAAHARALQGQLDGLSDPATVHVNMMRGTIATTPENLRHVLGMDTREAELTAWRGVAERLGEALNGMIGGKCPQCRGWGEITHCGEMVSCRCGGKYQHVQTADQVSKSKEALSELAKLKGEEQ